MDAMHTQDPLRQLADSYGVEPGYHDDLKQWRDARPRRGAGGAAACSAPREPPGGRGGRAARAAAGGSGAGRWSRCWWPGTARRRRRCCACRPAKTSAALACRLDFESGETRSWPAQADDLAVVERADIEGVAYKARRLALPSPLPIGWHKLTVQWNGRSARPRSIAAPTRAYGPDKMMHTWGVFLPLYALRTARDWGVGDFTDLGNFIGWMQDRGGGIVGTLPLLAAYLDEPLEPSPYSPASRLFWNELYVDPRAAAEFSAAQSVVDLGRVRGGAGRAAARPLVDYQRIGRPEATSPGGDGEGVLRRPGGRTADGVPALPASHPLAEDYARFRAAGEKLRRSWWTWPERMRDGVLEPGDYDEEAKRYHLYVQWLADAQVKELSERAMKRGPGLLSRPAAGRQPGRLRRVARPRVVRRRRCRPGRRPIRSSRSARTGASRRCTRRTCAATGYRYLRDVLKHHFQYAGVLPHRPPHGAAPPLLGAARLRPRQGRLRAAALRGAVRRVLPGVGAEPVRPGRRGPGHGAGGGAAGDGEAQHPPALHRPVRDEAGSQRPVHLGPRRLGGQPEHARPADVRGLLDGRWTLPTAWVRDSSRRSEAQKDREYRRGLRAAVLEKLRRRAG